jgi:hypothetical protein
LIIEAASFSKANDAMGLTWHAIPHLGHGTGAVLTLTQGRPATTQADAVYVEYPLTVERTRDVSVRVHLLPTLNTSGGVELRIGISIDEGSMQTLSMRLTPSPDPGKSPEQRNWEKAVIENQFALEAMFPDLAAGPHVIRIWRLDDNVLLDRLVVR